MPDWSKLQSDLLGVILSRMDLIEDYLNFSSVCKSWHSVANEHNFISNLPRAPWLMLAEEDDGDEDDNTYRKFYSFYNDMIFKKRIPETRGKRCMESMGWLITVEKENVSPIHFGHFSDVLYFNGNFYAVGYGGSIQVCDVSGPEPASSRIIVQLEPLGDYNYYILESLGSLFVVVQSGVGLRCVQDDHERILLTYIPTVNDDEEDMSYAYGTINFVVFKIDLDAHRNTPIRDLGDRAFFLGANASFSVQAFQFPGIKPNHIYFTDNCLCANFYFEEGGGLDMGVFNLANGSIQPHYDGVSLSLVCPPIWVTPTLC
ncbi:hypothetical protein KY285_020571 [Solanum tuberosum]|nr:hypothetical protein KY285_020571 [Solanum tuberosum]